VSSDVDVLGGLLSSVSERMTARLLEAGFERQIAARTAATIAEYVRRPLERLAEESRKRDGRVSGVTALIAVLEATLATCVVLANGVNWREVGADTRDRADPN
jgi:hypothetical protein